ncbi:type I secretion system permease/ATPase [Roseicyclus sp. F158]|uniref:Type I secretion system permease/ATPase n=1 Tax=Tropicimonas omnivorans TaxID=3075590 RepID=A0ABU3DL11_9RHOB|nr:type I secretion system permease/ATPase [Roseicyclus sp. F158]MDT0684400.1 type I secretion system permease/ATPase [Roseicyclus sp. F158]
MAGNRHRPCGVRELRAARREGRPLFFAVSLFSFFVNLLMLAGPLYMLNVYDRVLGSHSVETLLSLTVLVVFLYVLMGVLDYARGRVMGRAGARFQSRLDRRVFEATMRASALSAPPREAATGLRDLDAVQRLYNAPVLMALFDLPWTPLFFLGIFVFHPVLGVAALAGAGALIIVAFANQILSRPSLEAAGTASRSAEVFGARIRDDAELVQALGMRDAVFSRWNVARHASLGASIGAADLTGTFGAITKAFRLFLQSAMLGLGAFLVLRGAMTPGAMIAGSILLGRALAPLEQGINGWPLVRRAQEGWRNLAVLLTALPPSEPRTALPAPRGHVEAQGITVAPPGETRAVLRQLSFTVEPGHAVGVIGPSGSGKSSLAKALTGYWPPAAGALRLDGAALEQYEPDALGRHVGYLPQRVSLFEGTIRDNIARMATDPDDAAVVRAAKQAAAHDMIVSLPDGYDTRVGPGNGRLSGGQAQRIGLARALYGDPVLIVLDEPDSGLDNDGSNALSAAIRTMKSEARVIFVMAHRPSAIAECDMLLALDGGTCRAFGPKARVLRDMVQNAEAIRRVPAAAGVA